MNESRNSLAGGPPVPARPPEEHDYTPEEIAALRAEFAEWLKARHVPPDVLKFLGFPEAARPGEEPPDEVDNVVRGRIGSGDSRGVMRDRDQSNSPTCSASVVGARPDAAPALWHRWLAFWFAAETELRQQLAVAQAERDQLQQQVDRFENAQCITCAKDLDTAHAEND